MWGLASHINILHLPKTSYQPPHILLAHCLFLLVSYFKLWRFQPGSSSVGKSRSCVASASLCPLPPSLMLSFLVLPPYAGPCWVKMPLQTLQAAELQSFCSHSAWWGESLFLRDGCSLAHWIFGLYFVRLIQLFDLVGLENQPSFWTCFTSWLPGGRHRIILIERHLSDHQG